MDELSEFVTVVEQKVANEALPDAQVNGFLHAMYAAAGQYSDARSFIESASAAAPLHPLKRYEWMSILNDFDRFIDELEAHSSSEQAGSDRVDGQ